MPTAQTAMLTPSLGISRAKGEEPVAPSAALARKSATRTFQVCVAAISYLGGQRWVFCFLKPYLEGCQLPYIIRKGCQLIIMKIQNLRKGNKFNT